MGSKASHFHHKERSRNRGSVELAIALHLNRLFPEINESCELLLKPEAELNSIEKLQRRNVQDFLDRNQNRLSLPNSPLHSAVRLFALCSAAATLILFFLPDSISTTFSSPHRAASDHASIDLNGATSAEPIEIKSVEIAITPPAYTGKQKRRQKEFDIAAEEQSIVEFSLALNRTAQNMRLIFSDGDTVVAQHVANTNYNAKKTVSESGFYFISIQDESSQDFKSPFYKIEVIKDSPPELTILKPAPRTDIHFDESTAVDVQVLAEDDYRVTATRIIATLTKGMGEGVKFREDTLDFSNRVNSGNSVQLGRTLDLEQMGMATGDELYFFVEALDNRVPTPNRARSETYFIVLQDSSAALSISSDGIAVNFVPDYFRSQRQIIIETIQLIKDQKKLSVREFRSRSNELAHDQKSLRLRYGQFLGEEFDSGIDAESVEESEDNFLSGDQHEHDAFSGGDAFNPNAPFAGLEFLENGFSQTGSSAEENILKDFFHEHDSEENATLFSESIRTQLKAALAQMWDAELKLRLFQPGFALPFEYQALKLLKNVQQRSRTYVKRIGYEPPPLQPEEKRLTGELDEIGDQSYSEIIEIKKSFANIRQALEILLKIDHSAIRFSTSELAKLESAGQELARRAAIDPGRFLPAMQDLRRLIENSEGGGEGCIECLASVQKALWHILPEEKPVPETRSGASSKLSRLYFNQLDKIRWK
ncbi:MAG: DUF4175 family protein [bacterium]